jgi:ParB-like chromosome segregation protein Spo0J
MSKPRPLAVEYRDIDALIPYARNARIHAAGQIAQLAASIREFGWTNPVLVDGDNGILAGHGRVLAARRLGMDRVPVIELSHLNEAQKRAYVLADNKLSLNAGWDEALLRIELADLAEIGFNLDLTGFSSGEIADLKGGLGTGGDAPPAINPESWAVVVECAGEADQVDLIQRLEAEGRKVRASVA